MKRSLVLLLIAACGDNKTAPDGSTFNPDAPPDGQRPPQIVAVEGDFTMGDPGVVTTIDEATLLTHQNVVAGAVGDDPIVRHVGGDLIVVNRFDGNNVTVLDAGTLAVKGQIATGAGSNPQDVAVVGNKLYIPALGTAGVLVVDQTTNAMTTIDLSADDPGDGLPDCDSAYAVGTNVFVVCGILDNFVPAGNGKVHVIDSAADTVTTSFDLGHENPFGWLEQLPDGSLVVPTVDFGNSNAGCLEHITTTGTPALAGCVVDNTADLAGGYVINETVAGQTLYLAIQGPDFNNPTGTLRPFDLTSNTLGAALNPSSQLITDVTACTDGKLAVSDTGTPHGVREYDATHELTQNPVDVALPPKSNHGLSCY